MEETTPAPPPALAAVTAVRLPVGANFKDGNKKPKKGTSTGRAPSMSPTAAAPDKDNINIISRSNIVSSQREPKRNQIVPPEKYHNWKRHLYNGCDEVRSIIK